MKAGLYFTTLERASGMEIEGFYFPVAGNAETYRDTLRGLALAVSILADGQLHVNAELQALTSLLFFMQPSPDQVTLLFKDAAQITKQ